ncbi:cytochrome b5 domain-containing protein [Candidatus Woesearchaeota archaeon]|nr:cytochrome b5 domain-containing protein [Candidatus Woesearchaeota archaeon]
MKTIVIMATLTAILLILGCQPATTEDETTPAQTFSIEQISHHSTADDCWLLIDGKVYEVTEFIPSHPGGQALLQGCGSDATELYETRPMGSGEPHSTRARDLLKNYYIGDLNG